MTEAGTASPAEGAATNIHATMVAVGDRGVLIMGLSGAGKTSLSLSLVERAAAQGAFARLVADDQLLVSAHGGRLVCRAPASIAGLAERRGYGPARENHVGAAVVDVAVRLVDASSAPRVDLGETVAIAGVPIPALALPSRASEAAARAVEAWLAASQ